MIKNLSIQAFKLLPRLHMQKFCIHNKEPPQNTKITSFERLKIMDNLDKQTNIEVLRRELLNDTIQLPLKFMAYYTAPISNKATFFAELIRSCIDAMNHVILFGATYIDLSPTRRYPYGIEKVTNMIVLIPAVLFLYFGLEIQYEACHQIYSGLSMMSDPHDSPTALILYLLSIGIEVGVISRNVQSALKSDGEQVQKKRGPIETLKIVFSKKDPVLQALLFENVITLSSTLVPMLSASISYPQIKVMTMLFPSPLYEIVGSLLIGGIQIKLGFHLMKKNIRKLMGEESLDKQSMTRITEIIRNNPFVCDIVDYKAVMIGQRKFRFAAEITFDAQKINKEIIDDIYEKMERVIYTETYSDREIYLKDLVHELPNKLLAKLHQEIDKISTSIKDEFPNCIHDDLEINHKSLAELYTTDDLENNLYYMALDKNEEIPFEQWMLEEADQIINYFVVKDQKAKIKVFLNAHDYCKSIEYSTEGNYSTEDYEELLLNEDFRFSELQSELDNKDT